MAFLSQNIVHIATQSLTQSIKYVISAALQLRAKRWEFSKGIDYTVVWQVCPRWGNGCLEEPRICCDYKPPLNLYHSRLEANSTCTGFSVLFFIPPNAPLMKLIEWLEGKLEQRDEVQTKTKKPIYFPSAKGKLGTDLEEENDQWNRRDRKVCTVITAHHKVKVYKDDSKCILISITQHHQSLDFDQSVIKEIQQCTCTGRCRRRKHKWSSIYNYKSGIFTMSLPFGYGVLKAGRSTVCSFTQRSSQRLSGCL